MWQFLIPERSSSIIDQIHTKAGIIRVPALLQNILPQTSGKTLTMHSKTRVGSTYKKMRVTLSSKILSICNQI